MKRFVFLAFFVSFCIGFVPCSSDADILSKEEREYLQGKGTVVFVSQTNYPPFEFVDSNGEHTGMCIDLARWIATEFGFKAEFRDMPFQEAQNRVLAEQADVITSLFYSDKRDKAFDFTRIMFEVPASIFVVAERTDIKDVSDLNGKKIAMQAGDYAQDFLEGRGISFDIVETEDFSGAVDAVVTGRADAVVGDEQIVYYYIFKNNLTEEMKRVGDPLYIGNNCMASIEDSRIISILNKGILKAENSGILDRISQKWLGERFTLKESALYKYIPYLGGILLGIIALVLLTAVWIIILRREVRRRTKELELSEKKYRTIFENAIEGIYQTSPEGRFLNANKPLARLLGYDSPEDLTSTINDLGAELYVVPDMRRRLTDAIEQDGSITGFETQVYTKSGDIIWVAENSRSVKDAKDRILYYEGSFVDITKRKTFEKSLYEEKEKLEIITENIGVGILMISPQMHVMWANRVARRMHGESVMDTICYRTCAQRDDICPGCPVARLFQENLDTAVHEQSKVDPDGNTVWTQLIATAVRDDKGTIVAAMEVCVPITERKQMEDELAALNRDLENKVQERTEDLESKAEQLKVANERLKTLDKMKSEFLSTVSHELRTPMTSVLGFAKLIRKDFSKAFMPLIRNDRRLEQKGYRIDSNLNIIIHEGERLTRMINDVLDLARIEEGRVVWNDSRISPYELIDKAAESVQGLLDEKPNVTLKKELEHNIPDLNIDPDRMFQVLINLMSNAAKFTEDGAVTVALRKENSNGLMITVTDTGIGISEQDKSKIFDKFHQVKKHETAYGQAGGTGLGLAICRNIIKHYGGNIEVDSQPGKGSSFIVRLPESLFIRD